MTTNDSPAHSFLLRLAEDLSSGDVNFPTFLDAAMRIRLALNKPDLSVDALSRLVLTEPLVAAKVIRLANSAALNASGNEVGDVRSAVVRVGFASIRSLAISVAIEQLMLEKEMGRYADNARRLWMHSVEVAALSFVIARRLTRINPHEAMFAGLVHDIGHFYLLSRIARNPGVARDDDELCRILYEWHANIGHAVLGALDVPAAILDAIADHENEYDGASPATLANVLHMANRIAENPNPFSTDDVPPPAPEVFPGVTEILDESRTEMNSIIAALGR